MAGFGGVWRLGRLEAGLALSPSAVDPPLALALALVPPPAAVAITAAAAAAADAVGRSRKVLLHQSPVPSLDR